MNQLILAFFSHLWHAPIQHTAHAQWVQARGVVYGIVNAMPLKHIAYEQIRGLRIQSVRFF